MKIIKKEPTNKKIMYIGFGVIVMIIILGILFTNTKKQEEPSYNVPKPEEVVRQYFTAWNNKNYPDMYASISDGFKRIDPNAKDLAAFRNFAGSQDIEGVNIISLKEISNDGTAAQVDYSVEFMLSDGNKKQFSDKFTLKYRKADIILGWKLIHPYGENIDRS